MSDNKDDWNFSLEKPKSSKIAVRSEHKMEKPNNLSLETSSVPRNKTRSALAQELDAQKNEEEEDVFSFASPVKRGLAFVLDILFDAALVLGSYFASPLLRKLLQLFLDKYKLQPSLAEPVLLKVLFISCLIFAVFFFIVIPLAFFNHSFGKKLLRLKVRGDERYTLSINDALKREVFFKPLSVLLVAGLITPFFNKKRKSIHDMLSHTLVIDDN